MARLYTYSERTVPLEFNEWNVFIFIKILIVIPPSDITDKSHFFLKKR